VAIFLNRERISRNGSIYFPDPAFPFTRVYEPRNRRAEMAPLGQTSLVAEIPCQNGDAPWQADEATLVELVAGHFVRLGWFEPRDIVGSTTYRLPHAYPILELGYEDGVLPALTYLRRFRNLRLAGRNGCFEYTHLHDLMRQGLDAARDYVERRSARRSAA
jgi:protoporphyrinogen oxidase